MYNPMECTAMMEKSIGRKRESFTQPEKKVLNIIIQDNLVGRYNSLIRFAPDELNKFLNWCIEGGSDYFNATSAERWALEDAYLDKV